MARDYMAFKAGRAFRRPGTNFVDPSPTKGAIWLKREDDDLVHFIWRSRESDGHEEDLILFPGDAQFLRVSQCEGGRMFVLKFSSSSDRHFFWLQSASTELDQEFVINLNRVLRDPDIIPVWSARRSRGETSDASSSSTQQPTAPSSGGQVPEATPEQLEQLRSLVASMSTPGSSAVAPDLSLTDVLTPANLTPLFTSHPELVPALFPHLPPDLPRPPSAQAVREIVASQPFRAALANFDRALRTGLLGDLVRGLGLPEEAGTGVAPFLRAVAEQARRQSESGERMQED